jgi:multisubunit Na+/H+ antiporter MnhF subunit
MSDLVTVVIYIALAAHVVMMAVALWRIIRGENQIDRLMGVDLIGLLSLAVLILIALIFRDSLYIDVALSLAALGFVSTIALARFIVTDHMF